MIKLFFWNFQFSVKFDKIKHVTVFSLFRTCLLLNILRVFLGSNIGFSYYKTVCKYNCQFSWKYFQFSFIHLKVCKLDSEVEIERDKIDLGLEEKTFKMLSDNTRHLFQTLLWFLKLPKVGELFCEKDLNKVFLNVRPCTLQFCEIFLFQC